jgi:hypothetical protein
MMMIGMKLRSNGKTGYAEHKGQMSKTLKKCIILKKHARIKINIKIGSKNVHSIHVPQIELQSRPR